MHRNTRIPSQPNSPTHEPSASPSGSAAQPPVRRNLFSAHLSRRPASSQPQSESASSTHSHSQPISLFQTHRPELQPRTASQNSPFASPPHLPPTQLHHSFGDVYDPTISPNHPLSPNTSASLFPSSSIVAVHPVTGRPLLPTLPTLPPRLRLSDSDEEEEDDEEDDNDEDHEDDDPTHHDPFAPTHAKASRAARYDNHAGHNEASFPTDPHDDEADVARYERERFDSVVADLMTRYRSRRHHRSSHSSASQSHSLRGQKPAAAARLPRAQPNSDEDAEREAQEEKDELMGHLLAKLRQEVVRVEEEGWMFGEPSADRGGERGDGLDDDGGMGMEGLAALVEEERSMRRGWVEVLAVWWERRWGEGRRLLLTSRC